MLKQYSTGNRFKNNAKTLEQEGGGVVPISDFTRLAGMKTSPACSS